MLIQFVLPHTIHSRIRPQKHLQMNFDENSQGKQLAKANKTKVVFYSQPFQWYIWIKMCEQRAYNFEMNANGDVWCASAVHFKSMLKIHLN